jgi:hypothetical protein
MITRDEFIIAVKTGKFKFPFKREEYTEKEIKDKIKNFKKYCIEDRMTYKNYLFRNVAPFDIHASKELIGAKSNINNGFNFLGKALLLRSTMEDYDDYNIISDLFQEEQRLKARVFSKGISPWDLFHKHPEMIYDAAEKAVKGTKVLITRKDIREALWKISQEATSFRPLLLVSFIQLFKCKSVLDFCAGWGDRLIGAIGANVAYTGIDPNPNLHKGYKEIIKTYVPEEKRKNYILLEERAEHAIIPKCPVDKDGLYDCIFTSPPYFDLEEYIAPGQRGYELQSIANNKTEKEWFYNFLLRAVVNCYKHLKCDGILAININQKSRKETYIKLLIENVLKHCPKSCYLGVIAYANERNYDNVQPIWVFRRIA